MTQLSKKKVSFYEEMIKRHVSTEKKEQERQLEESMRLVKLQEEEQKRAAEELEKKIKEELQMKEALMKEQRHKKKRADLPKIEIDFLLDEDNLRISFLELTHLFSKGMNF